MKFKLIVPNFLFVLPIFCTYEIPNVKIEAFIPKGYRLSIPDETGVKIFAFHGNINEPIGENSLGTINYDITKPKNGKWIVEDNNYEFHIGDTINYWVFVQHMSDKYKKKNLTFTIKNLKQRSEIQNCEESVTTLNGENTCIDNTLLDETFDNLNKSLWTVNKYIPTSGENYEFNYYTPDCVKVIKSKLYIQPSIVCDASHLRGILNLTNGCTSSNIQECFYEQKGAFYLPPIISGAITSKFSFKFGKIDIQCKLPCGDWIYPEIRLIPKSSQKSSMMYLVYSRGNTYLRAEDATDIGGKLLLAGPTISQIEPKRSRFLVSTYKQNEPFCTRSHLYSMTWKPDEILVYVDGQNFGKIDITNDLKEAFSEEATEYFLHIGVGVGGINEFPDNYTSTGGYQKPWMNKDVKQLRDFYKSRNLWLDTWEKSTNYLSVDSIKISAI